MKKITLLIIEDNRLLRQGLTSMIEEHMEFKVVAAYGDCVKALQSIRKFKPDILLLDLGLRNQSSLQVVREVKKDFQETKVVVMDLIPTQADVLEFVKEGVSGFILKEATIDEFLKTIKAVHDGAKILTGNLANSLFSQIVEYAVNESKPSILLESVRMTKREKQVVELIADGFTNKEIAQKLHLSVYTVKSHVHNILEKLALHTRVQIAKHVHTSESYEPVIDANSMIDQ